MSAEIKVPKVIEIIASKPIEAELKREIVEDINRVVQAADAADEEKPPAIKKQWVILVSDPNGVMHGHENDLAGWVLQIPEDDSVMTTQERINRAVYEFNTTKRGRLMPAKTVGDALENIPSKHFKQQAVWVKTKVPVLVLSTDNHIPTEKSDKKRGPE